jgi:hypothetical protein
MFPTHWFVNLALPEYIVRREGPVWYILDFCRPPPSRNRHFESIAQLRAASELQSCLSWCILLVTKRSAFMYYDGLDLWKMERRKSALGTMTH